MDFKKAQIKGYKALKSNQDGAEQMDGDAENLTRYEDLAGDFIGNESHGASIAAGKKDDDKLKKVKPAKPSKDKDKDVPEDQNDDQDDFVLGVNEDDFSTVFAQTVTLSFDSSEAGYKNSLGHYLIEDDGTIVSVDFAFENTKKVKQGAEYSFDVPDNGEYGLFILADGYQQNKHYKGMDFENGELQFIYDLGGENERLAKVTDQSEDISLVYVSGDTQIVLNGHAYHTTYTGEAADINPDDLVHVMSGNTQNGDGEQVVQISFEDLFGGGDNDFNDVVIHLKPGISLDDIILGTEGDDVLDGTENDDRIAALAGDDLINGSEGSDKINGGDGNDTVDYSSLGAGIQAVLRDGTVDKDMDGNADDMLIDVENITGTDFADDIYGSDVDNILRGGDGDDILRGDNGGDTLYGDAGDDIINGNNGEDILYGGDGEDRVGGNIGNDTLYGEAGDDKLFGHEGDDILYGGADDDRLEGGIGNDMLDGGTGDDVLLGEDGDDFIVTGAGDDLVLAGEGDDVVIGGEGLNYLYGEGGNDIFGFDAVDAVADRIKDFEYNDGAGDQINISDILEGYTPGESDINDFVIFFAQNANTAVLKVNTDGEGSDFVTLTYVAGSDMTGVSVQDLLDNGTLIVDQPLIV